MHDGAGPTAPGAEPRSTAGVLDTAQWWILLATVALTPVVFSRSTFDVFNITELTTLWIGVVAAGALQITMSAGGVRLIRPVIWPQVLLYVAVLVLTTATSRAPVVSLLGMYGRYGGLLTIAAAILLAWMLATHLSGRPDRRAQLLVAIAASSLAGALYLLAQQVGLEDHPWLAGEGRDPTHPPGLLGNANFSGAHVALGVAPMAWLAARAAGWRRLAWVGATAVGLLAAGVSQSRGAMAAAAVALLVTVVVHRVPGRVVLIVVAATVAVPALAAVASNSIGWRDVTSLATADERLDLWDIALEGSRDHLWLGGGPDLYLVTFTENAGPELGDVVADEPHNVLLDHLDGSGLLGAGAWLAVVAAVAVAARTTGRRAMVPWVAMGSAYLAQAMLSIDAVPLLVWGWVAAAGITAGAVADPTPRRVRGRVHPLAGLLGAVVLVGGVAVAVQPFRADMAYRRGVIAANADDTQRAQSQFMEAIDRNPWEPRYHRRLGLERWGSAALDGTETLLLAREAIVDALDLFPDDPSANEWLGGVDAQLREIREISR